MSSENDFDQRSGNSDTTQEERGQENLAVLALRLGWLSSETLGFVRQGVLAKTKSQWTEKKVAGRLSVSDGIKENKPARRFLFGFSTLCRIAGALELYEPERLSDPLTQLCVLLYEFLSDPNPNSRLSVVEVRSLLETWSLGAWAELSAKDAAAARAMTYGASIADTYWFMLDPTQGKPRSDEETWKELLQHGRMAEQARRIGSLRDELPPYLADAMKQSLLKWGIEPTLKHQYLTPDSDGRPALPADLDNKVYQKLRAQNRFWRALVLGERTPESYLTEKDRREVKIWTWFWFLVIGLGIVVLASLAIWGVVALSFSVVPGVINWLVSWISQAKDDPTMDLITLAVGNISMLVALAGALWLGGRRVFVKWVEMKGRLERRFTLARIVKKTTVIWNE